MLFNLLGSLYLLAGFIVVVYYIYEEYKNF